jgi:hypothetical protein
MGWDEEEHCSDGNTTEWKIDVEAPPPANVIGKSTSKKRTNDRCQSDYTTEATEQDRAWLEAGDLSQDCQDGQEDSRCTNTLEGTTEDQNIHAGSDTTNQRTDFEDDDAGKVDPFARGNGEDLTECQHQTGLRQEISRDDPCEFIEGVESTGKFWERSGDDGLIQSDAENGKKETDVS